MKTSQSTLSSADICRRHNWPVGTVLRSRFSPPPADPSRVGAFLEIEITAIGAQNILARDIERCGPLVTVRCEEYLCDLRSRDWEQVT